MIGSKGFNLIELMIVVAIIGIIASVVLPVYQEMQCKDGNRDACSAVNKRDSTSREEARELVRDFQSVMPTTKQSDEPRSYIADDGTMCVIFGEKLDCNWSGK